MCGLYKGAGPAYHCPRQMRELGGFGEVLGKRTNAKHLLQGRNASFGVNAKRARQIFLQMDLFGWDTNAHLATEEEKHATFVSHNMELVGIFKKFQDICKRDLWKTCGFSGDPSYPRLAHAKVTDYESIPMLSGGRAFVLRH